MPHVAPAIVAAAESSYRRRPGETTTSELLADAARGALAAAGLRPEEVDGLGVASFSLVPDHGVDLAWRLGLRLRWLMDDPNGGASGVNLLTHARRAVEAGDASAVLLVAGDRLTAGDFRGLVDNWSSATRDHLAPIPTGGPNALFALLTRRHMGTHVLRREDYAQVVIAQRRWAALNPGALYREPLSVAVYMAAPLVADPLTRFDCVPLVAGADALVVTAADRQAGGGRAVRIRALVSTFNAEPQDGDGLRTGLAAAAPDLWEAAGRGPDEVDLVSVYDDYPAMVLVQLADLGYAPDGDVRRLVAERLATGALPVNTSGGQLCCGQAGAAGGMHGLVEAVRQLQGEAGERQVDGARSAVVSGYGMVAYRHGAAANAVVLEADW
jgi:acetyl-CoA acetyltransferase